jgi:hypothetical protein
MTFKRKLALVILVILATALIGTFLLSIGLLLQEFGMITIPIVIGVIIVIWALIWSLDEVTEP